MSDASGQSENVSPANKIRILLDDTLVSDGDLEAFIVDYFPSVHKKYLSKNMERKEKISALLRFAGPERILTAMAGHNDAQAMHKYRPGSQAFDFEKMEDIKNSLPIIGRNPILASNDRPQTPHSLQTAVNSDSLRSAALSSETNSENRTSPGRLISHKRIFLNNKQFRQIFISVGRLATIGMIIIGAITVSVSSCVGICVVINRLDVKSIASPSRELKGHCVENSTDNDTVRRNDFVSDDEIGRVARESKDQQQVREINQDRKSKKVSKKNVKEKNESALDNPDLPSDGGS